MKSSLVFVAFLLFIVSTQCLNDSDSPNTFGFEMMMTYEKKALLIHANCDTISFSRDILEGTENHLKELGYEVRIHDLYSMDWKCAPDREDFIWDKEPSDSDVFKYQIAQLQQQSKPDIELAKADLSWASIVIWIMPLHHFNFPTLMKSYIDRTFQLGFSYGGNVGIYENGGFAGKFSLLAVTTGGGAESYSDSGIHGPIDKILYPYNRNILFFHGFSVLSPQVAYQSRGFDSTQKTIWLRNWNDRLNHIFDETPLYPEKK